MGNAAVVGLAAVTGKEFRGGSLHAQWQSGASSVKLSLLLTTLASRAKGSTDGPAGQTESLCGLVLAHGASDTPHLDSISLAYI